MMPAWRASNRRGVVKGAWLFLLAFLAFAFFPTSAQAAWPAIPSDDEIVQAAQRFIQENATDLNLEDCAAIVDATERDVCWARRSMNTWFGPEITYRTEIVEASTLKIHHTAQTDPLIANAVILLYTENNYNEAIAGGERSTSMSYHTAVLEYSGGCGACRLAFRGKSLVAV